MIWIFIPSFQPLLICGCVLLFSPVSECPCELVCIVNLLRVPSNFFFFLDRSVMWSDRPGIIVTVPVFYLIHNVTEVKYISTFMTLPPPFSLFTSPFPLPSLQRPRDISHPNIPLHTSWKREIISDIKATLIIKRISGRGKGGKGEDRISGARTRKEQKIYQQKLHNRPNHLYIYFQEIISATPPIIIILTPSPFPQRAQQRAEDTEKERNKIHDRIKNRIYTFF